jgi:hypothetical protein
MTIIPAAARAITICGALALGTSALADTQDEAAPGPSQDEVELPENAVEADTSEGERTEDGKILVEGEKITDRTHPDYVRCRSERVMGSLAKRTRTCMTNREWLRVTVEGNKRANELVDEMRATSLPPPGR